jgi:hypothetical protein
MLRSIDQTTKKSKECPCPFFNLSTPGKIECIKNFITGKKCFRYLRMGSFRNLRLDSAQKIQKVALYFLCHSLVFFQRFLSSCAGT